LAAVPEKGRNDEVAAFALSLVEKIHNAAVRERSEEVIADWERDWIWFKRFYTSFTGEKVQAQLAGINELLALRAVQSGRIDAANDFFGEMLRWRPDPSEENNELRRQVIRAAESDDARAFAHGRVAELDRIGAIDLPLKMRVFFQGYYGKGAVYVVFWIFTGVILFFFAAYFLSIAYGKVQKWLGRRPAKVTVRPKNEKKPLTNLTLKEQSGQPAPQVDEGEKEDDAAPVNPLRREELGMFQQLLKGNKKGPGYMNVKEEPDEYGRLLDKFGLDDGVSEDDIKTAFRKVAKELHPDRVGPEGEEQFREFQIAYERLIEIRKSWFGR
jgi:hypothetical protein